VPKIEPRLTTVPPATTERKPYTSPPEASTPSAANGWGSGGSSSLEARRAKATQVTTAPAELSEVGREQVVQKKATCPFIGTAVNTGALPVRNDADKPLANIDDVVRLGNTGKDSDLGEVLELFARGNHAYMAGPSGKLDVPVPLGTFSLDFPGSQGSHAGHSGILQGDPTKLSSGRFSAKDFDRLVASSRDGYLTRSDIGKFIGGNIAADPKAKAPGFKTGVALAKDFGKLLGELGEGLADKARGKADPVQQRQVYQKLTKLLGEDNLVGSAGEFGLLTALLANSPNTKQVRGEPAYSVAELRLLFVDKQFPRGWETWTKSAGDWVKDTAALTLSAEKQYLKLT